jgi:hypothetical protein
MFELVRNLFFTKETFHFFDLPIEIQRLIISQLKYPEMLPFKIASKVCNEICEDEHLWAIKLKDDFPEHRIFSSGETFKHAYLKELERLGKEIANPITDYSNPKTQCFIKRSFELGAKIPRDIKASIKCLESAILLCEHELLVMFLKGGANPNVRKFGQFDNGESMLHLAAMRNCPICFEMLLQFGAELTYEDCRGKTAIENTNNFDIWNVAFENGLNYDFTSSYMRFNWQNLLILALRLDTFQKLVEKGYAEKLVEYYRKDLNLILNIAIEENNFYAVRYLIRKGADFEDKILKRSNLSFLKFYINCTSCDSKVQKESEQLLIDLGYHLEE